MKKLSLLLLTACTMIACSDSDSNSSFNEINEIRLASNTENFTRGIQDVNINSGQEVGLFVTQNSPYGILNGYSNIELTSDGQGGLNSIQKMYYPDNSSVNFLAFHPESDDHIFTPGTSNSTWSYRGSFTVEDDQNKLDDILDSDLMIAKRINVNSTPSKIALDFHHQLSKIEIRLTASNGVVINNNSIVKVLDVSRRTDFNITSTAATYTVVSNSIDNIETYTNTSNPTIREAILVPQNLEAGKQLFSIETGDNIYPCILKEALNLESGKRYNFDITVGAGGVTPGNNEISIGYTVYDWSNGGTITGSTGNGSIITPPGPTDPQPEDKMVGIYDGILKWKQNGTEKRIPAEITVSLTSTGVYKLSHTNGTAPYILEDITVSNVYYSTWDREFKSYAGSTATYPKPYEFELELKLDKYNISTGKIVDKLEFDIDFIDDQFEIEFDNGYRIE